MEKLLESPLLEGEDRCDSPISENPLKTFSVKKLIHYNKVSLSDITSWERDISSYIYCAYIKEICCATSVDIERLRVHGDKNLVETRIFGSVVDIDDMSEVFMIATMLNVHSSMFKTINDKHYSKEEFVKASILSIIGNHLLSVAASNESRTESLYQFVKFFEHIHKCIETGMMEDIWDFLVSMK